MVIAHQERPVSTGTRSASIPLGACITIITGPFVRREDATYVSVACIIRAGVSIVAGGRLTGHAFALTAGIALRTYTPVVTRLKVVYVGTAALDIAAIRRAYIPIIAGDLGSFACTGYTGVTAGARVAIITSRFVRLKQASSLAAAVISARIPIVAGKIRTACAHTVLAKVTQGTRIAVVADQHHVFVLTSTQPVACIGRAGVLIVAIDFLADASS